MEGTPIVSWEKVLRHGAQPAFLGRGFQSEKDWVYKYTIAVTSATTLISQRTYPSSGAALSAGTRIVNKYFK